MEFINEYFGVIEFNWIIYLSIIFIYDLWVENHTEYLNNLQQSWQVTDTVYAKLSDIIKTGEFQHIVGPTEEVLLVRKFIMLVKENQNNVNGLDFKLF